MQRRVRVAQSRFKRRGSAATPVSDIYFFSRTCCKLLLFNPWTFYLFPGTLIFENYTKVTHSWMWNLTLIFGFRGGQYNLKSNPSQ